MLKKIYPYCQLLYNYFYYTSNQCLNQDMLTKMYTCYACIKVQIYSYWTFQQIKISKGTMYVNHLQFTITPRGIGKLLSILIASRSFKNSNNFMHLQ